MSIFSSRLAGIEEALRGTGYTTGSASVSNRNYGSKTYAQDTYADLINAEYDDYQARFQPYEQKLMSLADSEALLDDQLSRISSNSSAKYKQAAANSALMNQKYGVQTNAREQNYNATQMDGQRGLAIAQAKNSSRLDAEDRQMGILSGSSITRQSALNTEG